MPYPSFHFLLGNFVFDRNQILSDRKLGLRTDLRRGRMLRDRDDLQTEIRIRCRIGGLFKANLRLRRIHSSAQSQLQVDHRWMLSGRNGMHQKLINYYYDAY